MKIALRLREPDETWERYLPALESVADVEVVYGPIVAGLEEAEVLVTTFLDAEELARLRSLRQIFLCKTGLDGLPLAELEARGIGVRASHANAACVAEHALALALALLHRIVAFDGDLRRGMWYADGLDCSWTMLSDLRAGILGYGAIGRKLHTLLKALGCPVCTIDRGKAYPDDVTLLGSAVELVDASDIVFCCLPRTPETEGMFDATLLARMDGKFLVNVGRADVCVEEDLYRALAGEHDADDAGGRLAGFASDVWWGSPDKLNRTARAAASTFPFEQLPNVVMSPHNATHERGAHERYVADTVDACIAYVSG